MLEPKTWQRLLSLAFAPKAELPQLLSRYRNLLRNSPTPLHGSTWPGGASHCPQRQGHSPSGIQSSHWLAQGSLSSDRGRATATAAGLPDVPRADTPLPCLSLLTSPCAGNNSQPEEPFPHGASLSRGFMWYQPIAHQRVRFTSSPCSALLARYSRTSIPSYSRFLLSLLCVCSGGLLHCAGIQLSPSITVNSVSQ